MKKVHFFKIILNQTLREKKLMIPSNFVRKYGNELSSTAVLRVPADGTSWPVELFKSCGDVWLQRGLQEFAESYSMKHGHLLVFEYERNSRFSVVIFDRTATEIDYPVRNTHHLGPNQDLKFKDPKKKVIEDVVSIGVNSPKPTKKRGNSDLTFSPPHTKMRIDVAENAIGPSKQHTVDPSNGTHVKTQDSKRKAKLGCSGKEFEGDGFTKRMLPLQGHDNANALQRAKAFKSKNPFFIVTMQPSYVPPLYKMSVPAWFCKKYFRKRVGQLILHLSDGKTWRVNYIYGAGRPRSKLSSGWKAFAEENCLEIGDVCVFELIKSKMITFKVSIFRFVEAECCDSSQGKDQQLARKKTADMQLDEKPLCARIPPTTEYASNLVSKKYPFFKVVMQSAYVKQYLYIPSRFSRRYVKCCKHFPTLQFEGRSWPAKFCDSGSSRISGGWISFARENSLQQGDVVKFELIDRIKFVLKVSIFRCKN